GRFLRRGASGKWMPAAEAVASAEDLSTAEARRKVRERLLQHAMTTVDKACAANQCDSIVVIAPERFLSRFRSMATDRVRVRLWRERAAETTSLSDEDIASSVESYFRSNGR